MTVIVERAIALSSGVQSCRLLQSSLNNLFSCVLRFVFRTCLDVRRCRCKLKNHRWSVLNFEYLQCPLRDFDYKIRQCIQNVKVHQVVSRSTKFDSGHIGMGKELKKNSLHKILGYTITITFCWVFALVIAPLIASATDGGISQWYLHSAWHLSDATQYSGISRALAPALWCWTAMPFVIVLGNKGLK